MHRTGSGALIFGIDADLVGGRLFSLFSVCDLSCALILVQHPWNKINAPDGGGCIENPWFWEGVCYFCLGCLYKNNTLPLKTKGFQCIPPRPVHWFCFRGAEPKSMHKIGHKPKKAKIISRRPGQRQSQKSMHPSPSGASTFLGSCKKCIDFLVKFRNVHRFFGDVLTCASIFWWCFDMCIVFLEMFWHVHRFFGEVPNMCNDYLRKLPACAMIFCGSFQHVRRYFWGAPSMSSSEVPNMSINTAGKIPTCPWFSGRRSQHVHGFSGGVPHMCMFLGRKIWIPNVHRYLGKFQMSIDILGYFSHDQLFFVEVEESSKCITFSLGTCLSSIGFQV